MLTNATQQLTGKVYRYEPTKPHQEYRTQEGKLVPGSSTISDLWPKYLVPWAAKEEREMILRIVAQQVSAADLSLISAREFMRQLNAAIPKEKAHKTISTTAARIGTIAHLMCQAWLEGGTFDATGCKASEVLEAEGGFKRFTAYWNEQGYRLHSSERFFTSERYASKEGSYGGTVDIIATAKDGSLHLLDLKTSKAIYEGHIIQVGGGYRMGCEDALALHISKVKIVRIGKGDGEFNPKRDVLELTMTQQAWAGRAFLSLLGVWKEMPH